MALGAAGAAFLLAVVRRDLSDILVKNGGPAWLTRQGAVNDGSAGDLQRYRLFKNVLKGPDKVGSAGERGRNGQPAFLVSAGGSALRFLWTGA